MTNKYLIKPIFRWSQWIWTITLVLFFLFLYMVKSYVDLDIWARLAVGKLIFENGGPVSSDIFAYTPIKDLFIDHEWGSSVVFYFIADLWGEKGLHLLSFFLFIAVTLFMHFAVKERINKSAFLPLYFLLGYGVFTGFVSIIRSHVFTYFFFALWIFLLERSRNGKNATLFLLPISMIFWANLHGGFVSGLGLLVMYGAGAFFEKGSWFKYLPTLAGCFIATFVNPYGLKFWEYLAKALTMDRSRITEWWPFNFLEPLHFHLGFKISLLLAIGLIIFQMRKKRYQPLFTDIFLMSITLYLGVRHVRHITFFCIASFPFISEAIQKIPERSILIQRIIDFLKGFSQQKLFRYSFAVLIPLAASIYFFMALDTSIYRVKISSYLPRKGIDFMIDNHLGGNLLTQFNWGSYAIWRLFPSCRVSLDGRYEEVYPTETYNDIEAFTNGTHGWERALDKYKNDIIMVRRNSHVNGRMGSRKKDWFIVYMDETCVIYLPQSEFKEEWIDRDHTTMVGDPFSTKGKPTYLPTQ